MVNFGDEVEHKGGNAAQYCGGQGLAEWKPHHVAGGEADQPGNTQVAAFAIDVGQYIAGHGCKISTEGNHDDQGENQCERAVKVFDHCNLIGTGIHFDALIVQCLLQCGHIVNGSGVQPETGIFPFSCRFGFAGPTEPG